MKTPLLALVGSLLLVAAHGSCPAGDLSCDDGECISSQLWCDGNRQCDDGSDEGYCKKTNWVFSDPNNCKKHFLCSDGRCVPSEAECNGHPDCKDASDEKNCEVSKEDEPSTEDYYDETSDPTTILVETIPDFTNTITPSNSGGVVGELDGDSPTVTSVKTTTTSASIPMQFYQKKMQNELAESTPKTYAPSTRESPQIDERIPRHPDVQQSYTHNAQRPYTASPQQPPTPHPLRHPFSEPTPHPQRPSYTHPQPIPYPQRPPYTHPQPIPYPQRPPYTHPQPIPYHQRPPTDPRRPPYTYPRPTPYPQRPPYSHPQQPPYTYHQPTPYAQRPQDPYAQRPQDPYAQRPQDPYAQRPPVAPYPSHTSHQLTTTLPYSRTYNEHYADHRQNEPTTYRGLRKSTPRFYFERNYAGIYEEANEPYVRRGAEWLLALRGPSGGWGEDTPRALVALALLNNSFVGGSHENDLMKKYFQVHLGVKLLSPKTIGLNQLAGLVNALLATCQDPTDFLGTNVLRLLREKQEEQHATPFVYLSLCLANQELSSHQVHALMRTLSGHLPTNDRRKDMLCLAISAFVCHLQQLVVSSPRDSAYVESLFTMLRNATSTLLQLQLENGSFGSVYSTALAAQALLSVNDSLGWDPEATFQFLRDHQTSNGSFGDFLATYYVLPALRGRSLLHLRNTLCHSGTPQEELTPQEILNHRGPKQYIRYSLHFGLPLSHSYSVQVHVPHGISFFDVMRVAEFQNNHFNFLYEERNGTMRVYSISDVPDDWERGLAWHLYVKTHSGTIIPRGNEAYVGDVRELLPRADQQIIFWYHPIGIRL